VPIEVVLTVLREQLSSMKNWPVVPLNQPARTYHFAFGESDCSYAELWCLDVRLSRQSAEVGGSAWCR